MKVIIQKRNQNLRHLFAVTMAAIACLYAVSAWATVAFVKPQDATQVIEEAKRSDIPLQLPVEARTQAPEPATMALFGGGFLGMIISFVRRTYAMAKRSLDIISCAILAILTAPVMFLTAAAIKLTSKGPIIYSQLRVGLDGQHFNIYKFRTMRVDAEKESGPVWAAKNDNRVTTIGRFLRKTRIDELPQLWNVIKGDMSLIGPRPERPVFVQEFKKSIPDYEKRLMVKPGITGLAQVFHRYDETLADVKKKVKYDLLYIKKMCMWADLRIIFRTVRVVLTGKGAR